MSDEAQSELTEQSGDSKRATGWHGTPRRLGTEVSRDRRMSIWGDSEADRRRYRGRKAKGQPGAFTTGTAEGERIEATRRSITGEAGGTERGATRGSYHRRGRRKQEPPGKPGTLRKPAAPKASEAKGNLSGDRRHSRRDEEDGANHRTRTPAQQKGSGDGATLNRNPG